jgi:serine/threonine protein kinase, bacterial
MIESSLLTPGNLLNNRYEIVRELGRGGFGRTYLAIDRNKFGEKCVMKEFAPQVSGQSELQKAKELFERETGILYKLKHSQIPAFRELLRVDGVQSESLFLVQDFVDGETYLDRVNQRVTHRQVFSEGEVVQFLYDLLPVLDYIHTLGVIHRDISPDNIMYRYSDRLPVLIDFGCVKETAANAVSRYSTAKIATRIGKQGYAPDEQMIRGKVSPASDLYAIAATALTLLTGKDATAIYNPAEAKWEWRKFVNLSPELSAIVDRSLQYNPQHRYQSAKELLAVLPSSANYAAASFNPSPPNNPQPINPTNKISQLKTIEISPRQANTNTNTATTELSARDPNEWKKPAWQVAKVMSGIFVVCVGVSAAVKWVQSIDPGKIIGEQINGVTSGIGRSSPSPSPSNSASPTVQQQQQDLNQKLKQRNIPALKFYRQVDKAFHAKHPELNGRSLTSKTEDDKLRQEWQELAEKMLAQQSN